MASHARIPSDSARRAAMARALAALSILAWATAIGAAEAASAECAEARRVCETRVNVAVDADSKLKTFLVDARARGASREASEDGSASGYGYIATDAREMAVAEMLALGCCLLDGECAGDAEKRARARGDDSVATAVKEARVIGGELLFAASTREDASKMPEARVLGADARTCAAAPGTTKCDDELLDAYEKSAAAGEELGILRAGDLLLRRYGSGLATRVQGENAVEECDVSRGGAAEDAKRALAYFKQLLASNSFDKVASERIREVSRAEEFWLTPRYGGKPDQAYLVADAVVRFALRATSFFASFAILYCFRGYHVFGRAWRLVRKVLLIDLIAHTFRRVRAFIAWLRWRPPVLNSRQARRAEEREKKKRH